MKKITVVHIEAGQHLYGGALQVAYLLNALKNSETIHNILICPQDSAIAQYCQNTCTIYSIAMHGDIDLGSTFRIHQVLKKVKADIVHIHSRRGADFWGTWAAKLSHCKSICTRRVDNPEAHWFTRFKYSQYDQVVAISDGIRRVLLAQGLSPQQVITIRSVIDTQKYQPQKKSDLLHNLFKIPKTTLTIAIVAQLIARKGHAILFTALQDIILKNANIHLIVLGQGPLKNKLVALAEQLNIQKNITFAGFRDDLDQLLPQFDLVVHPAFSEGLGVSLLQASACEVAIIASDAGGIPEAVEDGISGLIVPPGNVAALREAIEKLIYNPTLRQQLAKQGRRKMEVEFSIATMAERYDTLYCQLLEGQ